MVGDSPSPVCAHCGDILGVYEPIVVAPRGGAARRTSRVVEGELPEEGRAWHENCYREIGLGEL